MQGDSRHAFEEVYCGAFEVLDRHWLAIKATYMEFSIAMRCDLPSLDRGIFQVAPSIDWAPLRIAPSFDQDPPWIPLRLPTCSNNGWRVRVTGKQKSRWP